MKDALQYIVASIVEKPEDITIEESEENGVITFTITVAQEDIGKIIGKEGKVIRAIRTVMRIPAIKHNKKIHIVLSE